MFDFKKQSLKLLAVALMAVATPSLATAKNHLSVDRVKVQADADKKQTMKSANADKSSKKKMKKKNLTNDQFI